MLRVHKGTTLFCCTMIAICFCAGVARADWNVGDPFKMHYPQLPDLTPTGIDVLDTVQPVVATQPQWKILADDFRCTETGPINDVHIWGSWLGDRLPQNSPANVTFKLSLHLDVPVGSNNPLPYSHPGQLLWERVFTPGSFTVRNYSATGVVEHFFDPNLNQEIGTDSGIWQYNFTNIVDPWVQQKDTIYWLDVQTLSPDSTATFGWKTTNPLDPRTPHFQDDAVFADTAGFNGALITPWAPLVYPAFITQPGIAGTSMDLAFVITPEPAMLALVFLGATLLRRAR